MLFNGGRNERPERTSAERAAYRKFCNFKDELFDKALVDSRLSPIEFRVVSYIIYNKFMRTPDSQFFESAETIIGAIGTGKKSKSPVERALKNLEKIGYLICTHRGRRGYVNNSTTHYKLGDGVRCDEAAIDREMVPGDNQSTEEIVPGDNQSLRDSPRRQSVDREIVPGDGYRSTIEEGDSRSKEDSRSDSQEGTRTDDPDDDEVEGQQDRFWAKPPAGKRPLGSVGSFIGWDDRPSSDRPPEIASLDELNRLADIVNEDFDRTEIPF